MSRNLSEQSPTPLVATPIDRPAHVVRVPAWKRPFTALSEPGFRRLWGGMMPGTMAIQMGMVTTGYVAFDISGSATAVGIVALGWGIPMLLFGLWGGVVADRFPKRRTLLLAQCLIGVSAMISAALVLAGVIEVWHLALVSALQGIGFAFNMPSNQAFIAQLVSRENLMNAVALHNTGSNFARVAGPSLAGALIGVSFIGAGGVFVLMTLMYAFVVVVLVRIPDSGAPTGASRPPPFEALRDGLHHIRGNTIVFSLLLLAFAPVLLGMPYQTLMPVFAEDVFEVGPGGLGVLMAANGFGALIGSLMIASISGYRRRGLLQMSLGILFDAGIAAFAFGGSFEFALIALVIVGLASAGYQALNSSLVMHYTDPAYHGRVMSVYLLTFSAMPLGTVPFGALSDRYGAPITIGTGGLVLAAIVVAVGVLYPPYRRIA
ncbi:MAG: MFS transporter [Chloroflexota bacterium]|nr:MFS transporter [Chloroflexota bacterium]